jgi:CRP-like cAMP-binding protein
MLRDLSERERKLSRGESLFHDGDPVESLFLVVTGELRVTRLLPHGVELTLQRPAPGAIVHESSLFAERYACDARAARASIVRAVPVQRVVAAFRASYELAHTWARHLEAELHWARTQAEILCLRTVAERLDAWCGFNSGALPPRGRWARVAEEIGVSAEALYRELARRRDRRNEPLPALPQAAGQRARAA